MHLPAARQLEYTRSLERLLKSSSAPGTSYVAVELIFTHDRLLTSVNLAQGPLSPHC